MEPGGLRRPNSADSWVPPHMTESQCFYVSFWPEHVCTPCDWGGGVSPARIFRGACASILPNLKPIRPCTEQCSAGYGNNLHAAQSQTSTPPGLGAPSSRDSSPPWPLQVPPEGAQRCLLLLCLWSAEALFGLSKPSLGSRGLSRREVAGRGHFSMFGLVCFRKFPRVSTRKLFHCLSVSLSNPCPWELGSGPFCSGAISRG